MIRTKSLNVNSSDGSNLLKGIDLEVEKGETFLICGEPGSGKTILCKALKKILANNFSVSGTVETDSKIGFLFQNPRQQMVRRRVKDDLAFGLENESIPPEEIKDRIDEFSKLFDIENLLERDVNELSSGQVAKVALAGTLITEPETLILDEPFAGLDAAGRKIMTEQIRKIRKSEKTLIVAEHDLRDIFQLFDKLVLLKRGRIIESGSPGKLIPELYSNGVKLPFEIELKAESDLNDN